MNKRISIVMLAVVLIACVTVMMGCPVEEKPDAEANKVLEFAEKLSKLEMGNYAVSVVVAGDVNGMTVYTKQELLRDGNIFFYKGDEFSQRPDCYYETDGETVYQYAKREADGKTYWEKEMLKTKDFNLSREIFRVVIDAESKLLDASNYDYSKETDAFILKKEVAPLYGFTEGVSAKVTEQGISFEINLTAAYGDADIPVDFERLGEIELTLPHEEQPSYEEALSKVFEKIEGGNFAVKSSYNVEINGRQNSGSIEVYVDGAKILFRQTLDGMTVSTYFESTSEGVYRYDEVYAEDGKVYWSKQKTDIEDAAAMLLSEIFGSDGVFKAENYGYLPESGKYQLKEAFLGKNYKAFFAQIISDGIIFEALFNDEKSDNGKTVRIITVTDFCKVSVMLPEIAG